MKFLAPILLALIIAGCTPQQEEVRIGVIIPLTGPFATFGEQLRSGIEDAQTDKVTFIFEDGQCEPAAAVTAFRKLTEIDGVKHIIGPACGSPQEAVAPLAREKGTTMLLPAAASESLHDTSGGNMFQVQYSLEEESAFLAHELWDRGSRKVVLATYQNAFSQAHAASFKQNYPGEIIDVVFDEGEPMHTQILRIAESEPDAIYVTDAIFFVENGRARLQEAGVGAPLFSHYVTEFPPIRQFVENVTYSFPADVHEDGGIMYHFGNRAASMLAETVEQCSGEQECIAENLRAQFDENGIAAVPMELRQIRNGTPAANQN